MSEGLTLLILLPSILFIVSYLASYITHLQMSFEYMDVKWTNVYSMIKMFRRNAWVRCMDFRWSVYSKGMFDNDNDITECHASVKKIDGVVYALDPISYVLFGIYYYIFVWGMPYITWHEVCVHCRSDLKSVVVKSEGFLDRGRLEPTNWLGKWAKSKSEK